MYSDQKDEKLDTYRHSLSHIMAAAISRLWPKANFAIGPSIDTGFYYDIDFGADKPTEEDLPRIEAEMAKVIAEGTAFERSVRKVDEAIAYEEGAGHKYKAELIRDLRTAGETEVSYYQLGAFEDLCRGPHLATSAEAKPGTFKLTSLAGAYWRGDEKREMLTRIYGAAFLTAEDLAKYLEMMAEAERRNHRKIGQEMGLFKNFAEIGQGLPVWLPNGYLMRRVLEDYMMKLERSYGYVHILTPIINKQELFETSGHLGFYKDSMYSPITIDDETFYLKPMNCPAGMMVYKMRPRSYRELPYKQGEFGTVYRYEKSGELHGLQRVRGFTQNDAHIFCTPEQLEEQFMEVMEMLVRFYQDVGFDNYRYRLSLSDDTSDKYVGRREDWIQSEETLRRVLVKNKVDFYEVKGEAAFYGPKLDVQAVNVFGKEDSISTIQVDFNLPERFDLSFVDKDGEKKRPFVIHRALIGSFERFFAFLIEYYAGNFPLWLSPVQVKIAAVGEKHLDHVRALAKEFLARDIRVETDLSNETVGKKVKNAVSERVPYLLVVGDREMEGTDLAVKIRGFDKPVKLDKNSFLEKVIELDKSRSKELNLE